MSKGKPSSHRVSLSRAHGFIYNFLPEKTQVAGSLRRDEAKVKDIDLVTVVPMDELRKRMAGKGLKPLSGGQHNLTVKFDGSTVNVYHAEPDHFGATLMYASGPKGANIHNRSLAKAKGWKLNQYGLFDQVGKLIASDEHGIYEALGKTWRKPQHRGLPRN